jgi:NAD(P)-dependent dehydrogenase (short-subunit alcohol dehydrogenase family)
VQSALDTVIARWGRVDTAILSSGIAESVDLNAFRSEEVERIFATNVFGVTHWLETLHPVMRAQPEGGTIAVVSSLSADRAIPGGGAGYSASKAAVSQLCDGLRAPLKAQNIRLVTIAPGFVRTPMLDGMPWTPASVSAEQSAAFILEGLKRQKSVIRYPLMASLTMGLIGRLPPAALDLLYRPPR